MKTILIELDDRCARDLERVAPVRKRMRAEFIRLAIRRAIDVALDRETEAAYRRQPIDANTTVADLVGWDDQNELALPAAPARSAGRPKRATKRAA